jgi:hypothetical protein
MDLFHRHRFLTWQLWGLCTYTGIPTYSIRAPSRTPWQIDRQGNTYVPAKRRLAHRDALKGPQIVTAVLKSKRLLYPNCLVHTPSIYFSCNHDGRPADNFPDSVLDGTGSRDGN